MQMLFIIWGAMIVGGWILYWIYVRRYMQSPSDGFLSLLYCLLAIPIITMFMASAIDSVFNKPMVTYTCETFNVIEKKQFVVSRSNKNGGDYTKTIYWVGPNKYNFQTISTNIGDFIPEVVNGKIKVDIRTRTDWDDTTYYYQGNSMNCLK